MEKCRAVTFHPVLGLQHTKNLNVKQNVNVDLDKSINVPLVDLA